MPDAPKPVTVGDLQVRGEKDFRWINGEVPARPATVADLVSALRAEGVLVVEKVEGEWSDETYRRVAEVFDGWTDDEVAVEHLSSAVLDALDEDQ